MALRSPAIRIAGDIRLLLGLMVGVDVHGVVDAGERARSVGLDELKAIEEQAREVEDGAYQRPRARAVIAEPLQDLRVGVRAVDLRAQWYREGREARWPRAEKRRLELLKEAYVKARYSLTWRISREDLEVLAQRIAVLRERTAAVCQAYIESLGDPATPA